MSISYCPIKLHKVLGLEVGASPEEIKYAYFGMARKFHPDKYAGSAESKEESYERFLEIVEACSCLLNMSSGRFTGSHPYYTRKNTDFVQSSHSLHIHDSDEHSD